MSRRHRWRIRLLFQDDLHLPELSLGIEHRKPDRDEFFPEEGHSVLTSVLGPLGRQLKRLLHLSTEYHGDSQRHSGLQDHRRAAKLSEFI